MKRIVFLAGLLLLCSTSYGQVQTLLDGDIEHGGFGAHRTRLTWIDGEPAVMLGGEGAWLINHRFFIGLGGYGKATMHRLPRLGDGTRRRLEGGYGGLLLGYFFQPEQLVHTSVRVLVGAGGMAIMEGGRMHDYQETLDDTAFFVAEPSAEATVNVTRWFQVGIDASYRFTAGSDLDEVPDSDLAGPAIGLALRFGKF